MADVKASEIVTPDAMSGKGHAFVKLTAGANPLPEERYAQLKVNSGGKTKIVNITQEAGQQVVVIPEFDYLVLRYSWEAADGTDFDTATGFTNTGLPDVDGKYVGWSKNWSTTQQQVGNYLVHGGDNMQSGLESALINMRELMGASGLSDNPDVQAVIYANWYGEKGRGNVTVSFTAYLGGEMIKSGFNFVNDGGEEVYTGSVTTNVSATGHDNYLDIPQLYSMLGTMVYDKESRDCVILIEN